VRSFVHVDWVDGESVVQAEKSTGEDGFNTRFHHIEADLDQLFAQIAKLAGAVAGLRSQVAAALADVDGELNRLNRLLDRGDAPDHRFDAGPIVEMPNSFLGTSMLFDKKVTMWKTAQGLIALPYVNPDPGEALAGVVKVGDLARYVGANPPVAEAFSGGGMSVEDFVRKFGADSTPSGVRVVDLVAILPGDARFASADEMLKEVGVRQAAAIKSFGLSQAVVTNTVGPTAEPNRVGDAGLSAFETMPQSIRSALAVAGVTTVGGLADMNARELTERLGGLGFEVNEADAATWTAVAGTLRHL